MYNSVEILFNALILFLIVIDPIALVPMFLLLTQGENLKQQRETAFKACFVALVVLILFAIFGEKFLEILGISTPALQIAGGILLLIVAIEMVVANHSGMTSTTADETTEGVKKQDVSVFPLAIPLIGGPGALTAVVIKMNELPDGDYFLKGGLIGMIVLVIAISYVCLRFSGVLIKIFGITGTNVLARVFGIVLAALAIQFILNGAFSFMRGVMAAGATP